MLYFGLVAGITAGNEAVNATARAAVHAMSRMRRVV